MHWDVFCTVIDNFGDIGVTWRLARQLATEHKIPLRLWVDNLHAFQRIRPEIDPTLDIQHLSEVEIRHWTSSMPAVEPGRVVIEALACHLPEAFVARMATQKPNPLWLNLEYLTAEDWAKGVHALPSPHPRQPLTKYFFMPGYTPDTGGLTREAWLQPERDDFQAKAEARATFWAGLNLPPKTIDEVRLTLFSYENQALPSLLGAWADGERPIRALVPQGKALPDIAAWFGMETPRPGITLERGRLTLHTLPMLDQDAYDRLLWASDLNFVRGEDSFVRAQFAGLPMVWQAYRQEEEAHFAKLEAFLGLYCAGMAPDLARLTRAFWRGWNRETDIHALWPAILANLPALARHGRLWSEHLAGQTDLAANLLIFCEKKLE